MTDRALLAVGFVLGFVLAWVLLYKSPPEDDTPPKGAKTSRLYDTKELKRLRNKKTGTEG